MKARVIAMATSLTLLLSLVLLLTTHHPQFACAAPLEHSHILKIQGDNSSGITCGRNCQVFRKNDGTSNSQTQPAYRLSVHILSHLPGASTVGVYVTTKNGYTDQANVPITGIASWTFDIPQNQGNWVQVCSNYCLKYEATGKDMSVSLFLPTTGYVIYLTLREPKSIDIC